MSAEVKNKYPLGTRYWWLNEESERVLNGGYLLKGETVEGAVNRVVNSAASRLHRPDLAPVFKEIVEKGWMSLSSPIWANMGTERGLPISCNGVYIPDSIVGFTGKLGEVIMQTKHGAGTSVYSGAMRGRGESVTDNGSSSGAVSFLRMFDTTMDTISQGGVRRGALAAYLDIDHPDVVEFLTIKDIGSPIQNLFTGLCVPDYWLREMEAGDMEKRAIWAKVLESRQQKGLPYLFFSDNVNRYKPKWYIDKGMKIHASNLCSEITLPSSVDESFVCCLSSMNLELYEEWKDTDVVKMAIYFLDAVMEEYIEKTLGIPYMEASHNFAKNHRALGLGVLGWHSFLQRKHIPFDGLQAEMYNEVIFKHIRAQADEATRELAEYYGESPVTEGYGVRNSTVLSIAPTTSSSAILGQVSPGIEPFSSNYYKAGLAKGNFMRKNKYLQKLLEEKGINTEETWRQIMLDGGSVRNVQGLTQDEKDIFKTFEEVSQMSIINQAAARQKYIDQAQSVNLNIPPTVPVKEVNQLYLTAWKKGVKTLYYQRSKSVAKDLVTNLVTCTSCEA